ncbi:MAG: cysteine--tRNA ligase [Hyphomicrobiales bacterium]
MTLKLYNTLTRTKEEFKPLDRQNVRMYVCGPTVYDYAHIGNARPVIVFDVLFRLLRHVYGADHVTYVRNITDIDDKINARAREEGTSIRDLTERTYSQFRKDIAALGVLEPTYEPRATETIPEMITIIERLIASGHAYAAEGHVLFAVPSMKDYGQLSRRPLDEMIAGARVDVAPYKRDAMDFVLWKPSDAETPGWDSPWGRGRPGWHIECSAMSWKHLGEVFDIHGGGIDLVFPHHENELAQTRCAFGHDVMANIWMHNGFLQVEGQKMSKSLGNFVTINEVLEGWNGYAWPGEAVRFNMLRSHYRQPIDWTYEGLDESHKTLWDWSDRLGSVPSSQDVPGEILEALADDLNTPHAFAVLHKLHADGKLEQLRSALTLLGITAGRERLQRISVGVGSAAGVGTAVAVAETQTVSELIEQRNEARRSKNWAESDRIRDELIAMGILLKDNKDGTTSWEVKR